MTLVAGRTTIGSALSAIRSARFFPCKTGPSALSGLPRPGMLGYGICSSLLNKDTHPTFAAPASQTDMNDRRNVAVYRNAGPVWLVVALGVLLTLAAGHSAAQEAPAPDRDESRIDRLIEQLGHKDYFVRERAQAELAKYSFDAFGPLAKATEHEDLEIVARAKYLLQWMRLRWATKNDPAEVKELLANFETLDLQKRIERIGALAALPDHQGVAALCRFVRYHQSSALRKSAAAALLAVQPFGEPPPDEFAALVRKHLGSDSDTNRHSDSKTAAAWLTTYLRFRDDPAAMIEDWSALVEAECTRLKRVAGQPDVRSVAVLVCHQVAWHKKLSQRDEAVGAMLRLIDLEKNSPELLSRRLIWLIREKEYEILDEVTSGLSARFARNPLLLYDVAEVLADEQQQQRADRTAALALKATPDDAAKLARHYQIASILQQRGQFRWARQEYRYVIDSGKPGTDVVVYTQHFLAEMLHDQGQDRDAAKVLEELVKVLRERRQVVVPTVAGISGTGARMHYFAACHWADENDTARQRESLDKALEAEETDVDVLIACHHLPGQEPEYQQRISGLIKQSAEKLLEKAARQPDIPTYYNQYAWLIGNTEGDMDKALRYSQKSLELDPDSGGYLDTLAHVYFGRGEYEKAVATQTKAIEFEPHSGMIARKLNVFREKWEEEKAKEEDE